MCLLKDHVLANDMSEVGNLVLINTNHNIIIKQCVKEIVYVRSCTSEVINCLDVKNRNYTVQHI